MNTDSPSAPKQKPSFLELVKIALKGSKSTKMFPWIQSGIFLLGIAIGVFITSGVEILSGVVSLDSSSEGEVSEAEKCRDQGGRYDEGSKSCILVTSDRSESCSANSDCQGWCLADENDVVGDEKKGVCSDNYHPSGCFKFIDNGKVNEICMP